MEKGFQEESLLKVTISCWTTYKFTISPKTVPQRISEICKIPMPEEEQQKKRLLGVCAERGSNNNRKTNHCSRKCKKFLYS